MDEGENDARPGRSCPLAYRYRPADIARNTALNADCLYLAGGLYGNLPALDAIEQLAASEPHPPVIVFNGDFNWFNCDAAGFSEINRRVFKHTALRGNVETELAGDDTAAGCGCAYPDFVSDAEVENSNHIIKHLRCTACTMPGLRQQLGALPMHAYARVGTINIAIVHGDCESLAGWGLSHEALQHDEPCAQVRYWFGRIGVDVIASSHSCLPVLLELATARGTGIVINNGAAGMPNFRGMRCGVVTRIATQPARQVRPLYVARLDGIHIEALPVNYDDARWQREFLANWPAGSPAHASYYRRIDEGPDYRVDQAVRR